MSSQKSEEERALAPIRERFGETYEEIRRIKEKNEILAFDYRDPDGNKNARSHVASIRTIKGDVGRRHSELKAEAKKFCDDLDAVKRELTAELDACIQFHAEPLERIKQEAKQRAAEVRAAFEEMQAIYEGVEGRLLDPEEVQSAINAIGSVEITPERCRERFEEAQRDRQAILASMADVMAASIKRREEAEELVRLRREAQEAKQKQREQEAANAAKLAAEKKAKQDADDAAAREKERADADAERIRVAEQQKEAAEQRERDAAEALKKAKEREKAAAEKKEQEEAKEALRIQEEEKQAEKNRAAEEAAAAKRAQEAAKYRHIAISEGMDDLEETSPLSPEECELVMNLIADGRIRHVDINLSAVTID